MQHKTTQKQFLCTGMALSLPIDSKVDFKYKFLKNIRVLEDGTIESRPGINSFRSLNNSLLAHTIKKLADKNNNLTNYIVGAGTKLLSGNLDPLVEKASGLSGLPLDIVVFRPEQSLEAYAYIADKNKMLKLSVSDVLSDIGLDAPTKAIGWQIAEPAKKVIDNVTAGTLANWVVTNGVATIQSRVNTTVSQYLADGALPNFVSIVPAAFSAEIQEGAILTINGLDRIVEKVVPSGLAASVAIIAGIKYDAGTTGLCHITLDIPVVEIYRDSILLLNGTEYVRVIDVIRGNDGVPVIRTKTIGTFAATNTVSGLASFRVFSSTSFAAGNTIVADGLRDAIVAAGVSNLTNTINLDLTNANGKPLSDDALFHISLKADDLANIEEIQIQIAFDTGFIDYLLYVVNPNFLASSILGTSTTIAAVQAALQRRDILDLENPRARVFQIDKGDGILEPTEPIITTPINETVLGQSAWTELFIPFNKFQRVGADSSKTRKDIKAIRISTKAKAATNVYIDSIWVGGASGADSVGSANEVLFPYNYIYRFRNPATGVPSNYSPPLREGLVNRRNDIVLSIPINSYPSTFKVDIFRIGGNINDFRLLSSILNDGSTFIDNIEDNLIADNEKAGRNSTLFSIGDFDYFKPFALLDKPKSGTCNVVGTILTITAGDLLDVSYPRGTYILVGGKLTRFYTNPASTSLVELEDNLGTLTGVKFEIKEPLLVGQPLPILAGPFGEGFEGLVIFGAGDKNAPGTLYWLDANSPDTQSDINKLEITSPNEPIIDIIVYDSYVFVYTTIRSFSIQPYQDSNGNLKFAARENANSKGLFAKKGVCVARTFIYQLVDDGIYRSEGVGNPQAITDGDLHSLFPHNGVLPEAITFFGETINPPDFTKPDEMWLFSTEDHIFWRFIDIDNKQVCLVYDTRLEGWISYDTFSSDKVGAIYKEEGENDTNILVGQVGSIGVFERLQFIDTTLDKFGHHVNGLESIVIPFANDLGDFRLQKKFFEVVVDAIIGEGFTITTAFDNATQILAAHNVIDSGRTLVIENLADGLGIDARNIINKYKWDLNVGTTKLYKEAFTYVPLAEIITDRSSDFEPDDSLADRFWQGLVIEADTFGLDKTLKFYDDNNELKATLVINHNGKMVKSYSFNEPFISHKIRRASDDKVEWIFYNDIYKFDIEPELGKVWESQFTSHGIDGFKQIKLPGIVVASNEEVRLILTFDNEEITYPIPPTGGVKKIHRLQIAARKFDLIKYRLESDVAFRNYKLDTEVWIRRFNSQEDFQVIKPFGELDNQSEVRI